MKLTLKTFLTATAISLLALSDAGVANAACRAADGYAADFQGRRVFLLHPEALEAMKARLLANPQDPAYVKLMKDADAAMSKGPWTVTSKSRVPPSKDIHDYASLAPYWWPDPSNPSGPYIRKDGNINPERATDAFDVTKLEAMTMNVEALGYAYYFTGDAKYAERAAMFIRVWFLDPQTRMNPNVNFGQNVPGVSNGRAEGVIDMSRMARVIEAVGLMAPSGALKPEEQSGLQAWFGDLVTWMGKSPVAKEERDAKNNHGTHYDLQYVHFAMFANQPDVALKTLKAFAKTRINTQIKPDGSMPLELTRTRSLHYVTDNASAMFDVAALGECMDVDLWSYEGPQKQGLRIAADFLADYAGREREWKWQEISMNPEDLYEALLKAANGFEDPDLGAKARIYSSSLAASRINIINALLPVAMPK